MASNQSVTATRVLASVLLSLAGVVSSPAVLGSTFSFEPGMAPGFKVDSVSRSTFERPTPWLARGSFGLFPVQRGSWVGDSFGGMNPGPELTVEAVNATLTVATAGAIEGAPLAIFAPMVDLVGRPILAAIRYEPSSYGLLGSAKLAPTGDPNTDSIFQGRSSLIVVPGCILDFVNTATTSLSLEAEVISATIGVSSQLLDQLPTAAPFTPKNGPRNNGRGIDEIKVIPSNSNSVLQPVPESHSLLPLLVPVLAAIYPFRRRAISAAKGLMGSHF